jgi:hypothetical protein
MSTTSGSSSSGSVGSASSSNASSSAAASDGDVFTATLLRLKSLGSKQYVEKKYSEAVRHFEEGIALFEDRSISSTDGKGITGEAIQTASQMYSNLSAAHLELGHTAEALSSSLKCMTLTPTWAKAHYRMGSALAALKRHREAAGSLAEAQRLTRAGGGGKDAALDTALALSLSLAVKQDVTEPITSLPHFRLIFRAIERSRGPEKMCMIATFWNECDVEGRWAILERFLSILSGSGSSSSAEKGREGGSSSSSSDGPKMSDFSKETLAIPLPLHNFAGITLPKNRCEFFSTLKMPQKVELMHNAWRDCTEDERGLIIADIRTFYWGASAAAALAAVEAVANASAAAMAALPSSSGGGSSSSSGSSSADGDAEKMKKASETSAAATSVSIDVGAAAAAVSLSKAELEKLMEESARAGTPLNISDAMATLNLKKEGK